MSLDLGVSSAGVTSSPTRPQWMTAVVVIVLVVLVWTVFGGTLRNGFVNFDDDEYVYQNQNVSAGLSMQGVSWAFTHVHSNNWHPLTWISHMVDCELFGLRPTGHHFNNLVLHAATAVVLFLALCRLTGAFWCCAWTAAVFAVHPVHVESVAWISERKDVLSGLFFGLTLWTYARYVQAAWSWRRYLVVVGCFALGLMSKPSLVSLPLVLLLLDYWPLRRFTQLGRAHQRIWLEKIPLFVLSFASSLTTLLAQKGALQTFELISLPLRAGNAVAAYAAYLGQTFWPVHLAVFYPYELASATGLPLLGAAAILLTISAFVFAGRRRFPFGVIGWLWFIIVLVPVIGLIQVGSQAHADRYLYLSQTGLVLGVAWGMARLAERNRLWQQVVVTGGVGVIIVLAVAARAQTGLWRDSVTLWSGTIERTRPGPIACNNLGSALYAVGRKQEAAVEWSKAADLDPAYVAARDNLAIVLLELGHPAEAIIACRQAIALDSHDGAALGSLGIALQETGQIHEALSAYEESLKLAPDSVTLLNNYAWGLATSPDARIRDGARAVHLADRAIKLTGHKDASLLSTLAAAYAEAGRWDEAVQAAHEGLTCARLAGDGEMANKLQGYLQQFESHQPLRAP